MSVQVKRRRDTVANLASFTGAQAELLVDTTNNRLQVHDGVTPGGWPAAKLSEVVTNMRTVISDSSYAALTTDRTIAFAALTAPRTVSLPAASAFPTGTRLLVVDESGNCSLTSMITLACAGSDTISGVASFALAYANSYVALESDGVSKWTVVDASSPQAINVFNQSYGGAASWSLTQRNIASFPVPSFRPTTANTVVAFDIMPNGTPSQSAQNGAAWMDVCEQDILITTPSQYQSTRVGISSSLCHFGSRGFGTSPTLFPISFNFFAQGGSFYEAMRIYPSGSVTIGSPTPPSDQGLPGLTVSANAASTSAPANTVLYVVGANGVGAGLTLDSYGNGVSGNVRFRHADGTGASPSAVMANEPIGTISAFGYGATGWSSGARASVILRAADNWTDSDQGTYIAFSTTPIGSTSSTERVRIDNTGYLGVGTTTPAQMLDVNGAIAIGGATAIGADRSYYLGSFTVATLPVPGSPGRAAFASNGRMFNGAGTLEGAGAGTGGLVVDNGAAWKIAGTNQSVQA